MLRSGIGRGHLSVCDGCSAKFLKICVDKVMRKRILLVGVVLFGIASVAVAEEKKLGVTLQVDYLTKWLSKGFPAYGSKGAMFETLDLDFYESGFGTKVTWRNSTSSGFVDRQRFDFRPYYRNSVFEGERYLMNYNISVGYEYYPGLGRKKAPTTYEWIFAFCWPEILPGRLVPEYIAHYEYPAFRGQVFNDLTGWVHRFRLGYELNLPEIEQPIRLSSEVAYNDGLGGAAHDWSYATFGAATNLKVTESLSFVPGIYYQISMDKSVNDQNELYGILSMKYKF